MDFIVGLSIGASKVVISLGYINKYSDIQLLGSVSKKHKGIRNRIIVDKEDIVRAIKSCKEIIENKYDIELKECLFSIPSYLCELFKVESRIKIDPEKGVVSRENVDEVYDIAEEISFEGKSVIGLISEEFLIDGKKFTGNPVGHKASRFELTGLDIAINTDTIKDYIKVITNAGLIARSMTIEPISESNFFSYEETKKTVALVNIGAGTTTINIFKKNELIYSEYLNLGGDVITKDIARCLDINLEEADNLKVTLGAIKSTKAPTKINTGSEDKLKTTIPSDYLNQIISARVYEMFKHINKVIERLEITNEINEIVLLGGGVSLFEGVKELAKEVFTIDVKSISDISIEAYNPLHTSSIGIIKESYKVQGNNSEFKKESYSDISSNNDEKNDANESIFTKIKSFIQDFF